MISVVVPAFNDEEFLEKTLLALKRQDFKGEYEVVVVDNGSSDRTLEIAKKFGARIVKEKKRGEVFARGAGFKAAQGEIIASTDSDTCVFPNWLSVIAREFEKDKDLVAISGWLKLGVSNPLFRTGCFVYNIFNFLQFRLFGLSFFTACNMAVRKEAFLRIGGFRPSALFSTEADFYERVRKLGRVNFISDMTVYYNMRTFQKYGYFKVWWPYARGWFSFNFLGGRFSPKIIYYTKTAKSQLKLPVKVGAAIKLATVLFFLASTPIFIYALNIQVEAKSVDVSAFRQKIVYQTRQIKEKAEPLIDKVESLDLKEKLVEIAR